MTAEPLVAEVEAAWALTAEVKQRWRAGDAPDAAAVLASHPQLARHRSVVIDLAYDEFILREKAGDAPNPDVFADQFPSFRMSIRDMLDAHRMLVECPDLIDSVDSGWPKVGEQVEGLDLTAELGRGTFGRVYLAFDPGTDRLCVLKLAMGGAAEGRVIGRLVHPHVTEIYWARRVESRTAVCMPFVGVSTLADVIAAAFTGDPPTTAKVILDASEIDLPVGLTSGQTPVVAPDEPYIVGACAIGARIAHAVAYLHGRGVIHGDLKPSNVVMSPGGFPRLIDFNLSAAEATPGMLRGTVAYMAPELLDAALSRKPPRGIDEVKTDLFAFGVVLFDLVAGRHPFTSDGSGALADLAAIVRQGPPALPDAVPQCIAEVIRSCLAPDPALRPGSAAAVAAILDRYVADWRTRGRRWVRRLGIAAAIVAAAALVGLAIRYRPATHAAVEVPPQPFPIARAPETSEEFFARARIFMQAEDFTAAHADFNSAYRLSQDARVLAYSAYCLALTGQPVPAALMGERAIGEGVEGPEVRNNLGYTLVEAARPADAIPHLDKAIELAPRMQAAWYNRALARYRSGLALRNETAETACTSDIDTALAIGPPCVELHFNAAIVYASRAKIDPECRKKSLRQIEAAIKSGKDPVRCREEYVLRKNFGNDPEFVQACSTPRGTPAAKSPRSRARLVEPRLPDRTLSD